MTRCGPFAFEDAMTENYYPDISPVKTGIAGEKYLEVLSGVKEGEEVIVGPFNSVRDMKDGDAVKVKADDFVQSVVFTCLRLRWNGNSCRWFEGACAADANVRSSEESGGF